MSIVGNILSIGNILRSKSVVGLDIGSSNLKLVELKKRRNGCSLISLAETSLPVDSIVDKSIKDVDALTTSLYKIIDESGIKNRDVAISLSGNSVMNRVIKLKTKPRRKLSELVIEEVTSQRYKVEDLNYDYDLLSEESSSGEVEVLFVAAKKNFVDDYVSVVRKVGLNPVVISVDMLSLMDMYELNYDIRLDETVVLIDIGASFTTISILKGSKPLFTRIFHLGGNQFTELIMKSQGVSFESAERSKREYTRDVETPFGIQGLENDYIAKMVIEIKRNMSLFTSNFPQEKISEVVLSGGSPNLSNMMEAIEEIIKAKVVIADPFSAVEIDSKKFDEDYIAGVSSSMAIAVGLAARCM